MRSLATTKLNKNLIVSALVGGALSFSAGIASAVTVVFTPLAIADLNGMTPTANPSPSSTTPVFLDNVAGNQSSGGTLVARTPWEGSIWENSGAFSSVQAGGSATFTFAGEQDGLSLIWGSPDDYNDLTITLTGGGAPVSINGADVQGPVGELASLVIIKDVLFSSVLFESSTNAFEFANLTPSPVPLPAGVFLMGTAIAGFGVMRRRKKK